VLKGSALKTQHKGTGHEKEWQSKLRACPLPIHLLLEAMKRKGQKMVAVCLKWRMVSLDFFVSVLILGGTGIIAFGFLGFGNSASWKEEVLLRDGRKIIMERSQSYGGHSEAEQSPIKEQS
jgi:hypothetical protein